MSRIVTVWILSLFVCTLLVQAHVDCDEDYCPPPVGDLASGRVLSVNSSCESGETFQEVGFGLSVVPGVSCDSNSSHLNDGKPETRWVSMPGDEMVLIQLDLETEFRLLSVNINFESLLPSAAVLEGSSDAGSSWRPLQFYSTDCDGSFGLQDKLESSRKEISDVVCTSQYTGVDQVGGSLRFRLVLNKHLPFWATNPLHLTYPSTYLVFSNLRLRLLKFQDTSISISHYYSISSFEVEGACHCFGHADTCLHSPGYEGALVPGVCECLHNTGGEHCGMCQQGFNKRRWSVAYPGVPGFCQRCECNSHSTTCYYDTSREVQVCDACEDNTAGDRCDKCVTGHFQNPVYLGRGWLFHPEICRDCACDTNGSLSSQCDAYGYCSCKANVMGAQCNRCKPGFYGLSEANPDGCQPCNCGTGAYGCDPETGACLCKKYSTGLMCQTCVPGYYGPFETNPYGCTYCRCAIGATLLPRVCYPDDGTCLCKKGVEGEKCSRVSDGYYVEEITDLDVNVRLLPLAGRGDRIAKDLVGIYYDDIDNCDAELSAATCCSYAQKLVSIYLNNGGLPCMCHSNGTQSDTQCDKCGGQCVCRDFTAGRSCDQCSSIEDVCGTCPRASPTIGDCLDCFCNGFSQECSVAGGWEHQLIASDFNSQDWVGESDANIEIKEGYNPILSTNETHLFYYLNSSNSSASLTFPPEYLGNKRNTYSNRVYISLRLNFDPASVSIELESSDESILLLRYLSPLFNTSVSGVQQFSFVLTEYDFIRLIPENIGAYVAASVDDVRRTLAGVRRMELRVSGVADVGMGAVEGRVVELFNVRVLDSVESGNESQLASNVEMCVCPVGHIGQFCERCSPGYTRSPENGGQFAACVTCNCNNHSATCDPEEATCSNCRDNTEGKYCHTCREGFYGDATSPRGCLPCQCPTGPNSPFQVSNSCVAIDPSQPEVGHVCECPATYIGQFCEGCVVGYRGEPREGEPCTRCDVCYDQYLSLVQVIPGQLSALEDFVGGCQDWADGFDYLERLNANISTLKQLISEQALANTSSVCMLKQSLSDIRGSLREIAGRVMRIQGVIPGISDTVQGTEKLTVLAKSFSDSLASISLPNIGLYMNLTRDTIFISKEILLSSNPDLVNSSNSFYLEARRVQVTLYEADIAISRSIQLYLSLNTSEIPVHLDMLERFRNVVYEVSTAANRSLCGGTEECNSGTYQRIVFVAEIFQSYITNLTQLRNQLLDPYNALLSNKSSFESLQARLMIIRDMVIPLNSTVCTLVPVVAEWIDSVNLCLQGRVNASELEVVSTEILQLSISLTVSETLEIIVFINRTLNRVLINKQYLTAGAVKLELTDPFISNLTFYLNKLNASYVELLSFSSNLNSRTEFISQELEELKVLRESVSNLSRMVDVSVAEFNQVNASIPGLTDRVYNASEFLNQTLELRLSNQVRLSDVTQNGTESIQAMTALRTRSENLVDESSELAGYTRDLSVAVVLRFKKLNDSYPRLQVMRARILEQEAKAVELQEIADNIANRQTALEALLEKTEVQIETNLLSGQLQEIDGTGKCLNYVGEAP